MFHRQKLFLVNDSVQSFFLTLFAVFIYLYLAVLGLRCCVQVFSSCSKLGLL